MTVEAKCGGCGRSVAARDELAGRRVKCPKCGAPVQLPSAEQRADRRGSQPSRPSGTTTSQRKEIASASKAAPAREPKWYLQTSDGQQFGPVEKGQIDSWVAEGRVNASCQLLQEGWSQWQWVQQVYPQLAAPASTAPASPAPGTPAPSASAGTTNQISIGVASGIPVGSGVSVPQVNPYASPQQMQSGDGLSAGYEGGAQITPVVRRALSETRPWVITLAVVGFIWGGLFLLLTTINLIQSLSYSLPAEFVLLILLVMIIHVLILFASYFALKYGLELGVMMRRAEIRDLAEAARAQRAAWQFVCLVALAIVATLLFLILLVGTIGPRSPMFSPY